MWFERLLYTALPALCCVLTLAIGINAVLLFQEPADTHFHQVVQTGLTIGLVAAGGLWIRHVYLRGSVLKTSAQVSAAWSEHLRHRLDHDRVTGLVNDQVFAERVETAASALSPSQTLCVLSIELVRRGPSGEALNTKREEALLAAASDLLRHVTDGLRARTLLARSSGRGFLLMVVADSEDPELSAPPDIARAIHDIFLRPVQSGAGSFLVSPVIGYDLARQSDGADRPDRGGSDIICNANLAAASANDHDRRQTMTYKPVMRAQAERRTTVEDALPRAIDSNDCLPHFQPQFNLATGRIYGVEALARWHHPDLGWVSPSEFIPIAERNGDIISLGWKILQTSCSEIQLLPQDLSLSVNLSVAQILRDDVVTMLEDCLERSGLPPARLKLEVAETTLLSDFKHIRATLSDLRALGVGISLDNFGADYSALACLSDFHWDEIKIDRSLASRAVTEADMNDILKLILGYAGSRGTAVVIEGIETVDQRDALVDLGCSRGQGYLFGGPMAIDDITTLFFPEKSGRRLALGAAGSRSF